jgi:hypothetical protein
MLKEFWFVNMLQVAARKTGMEIGLHENESKGNRLWESEVK